MKYQYTFIWMKRIGLVLMICLLSFKGYGQITFQKNYGGLGSGYGQSVIQTSDGGYIMAGGGADSSSAGTLLIKTDANGDTLWIKLYTFGHAGSTDIHQTNDGGYIITGCSNLDLLVFRINANGDTLWTREIGGVADNYGNSVQQTSDGGFILTGTIYGGGYNLVLIKWDANGTVVWVRTFGYFNDYGNCVKQTNDGGYIIAGSTRSFGIGIQNVYLIKTDSLGDTLWTKTYGGTKIDAGNSVCQTTDGGYIIVGSTNSNDTTNLSDVYLIKTYTNGDTMWTKTYGGAGDDLGQSVQQTNDGGYIIAGTKDNFSLQTKIYLIKTNSNGDTLWTKSYQDSSEAQGAIVQQTSDRGYIISGIGSSSYGAFYLIKTDSLGFSGCNDFNTTTKVGSPHTQVTKPHTIVTYSSSANVSIRNMIIVSGGVVGTICFNDGINEVRNNQPTISLYPNPNNGTFTLSYSQIQTPNSQFRIEDVLGRTVYTHYIYSIEGKETIDVSGLSNGVYFYQLINNKETMRGKFVKE